ncbi:MAG TPA: hypothetical protein VHA15_03050 [Burkholderiales bacterium]|nr:hypothetical protein [Burkholderiales bacterium]
MAAPEEHEPERGDEPADIVDATADGAPAQAWWQRSAPLAAGAALAIGAACAWFGGMLGRVPLDSHSTIGYLLMMPLLLIVPAFSLAALRLAWSAWNDRATPARAMVAVLAVGALLLNLLALARFISAVVRIFSN